MIITKLANRILDTIEYIGNVLKVIKLEIIYIRSHKGSGMSTQEVLEYFVNDVVACAPETIDKDSLDCAKEKMEKALRRLDD